jgi:hypothetical protein
LLWKKKIARTWMMKRNARSLGGRGRRLLQE